MALTHFEKLISTFDFPAKLIDDLLNAIIVSRSSSGCKLDLDGFIELTCRRSSARQNAIPCADLDVLDYFQPLLDCFSTLEAGFEGYLKWRKSLGIPFAECAIKRELGFFSRIMGQEADQLFELDQNSAIITLLQFIYPFHRDFRQNGFFVFSNLRYFRSRNF